MIETRDIEIVYLDGYTIFMLFFFFSFLLLFSRVRILTLNFYFPRWSYPDKFILDYLIDNISKQKINETRLKNYLSIFFI